MAKKKDLTGLKFNRLTVLSETYEKGVKWICKCDCGGEVIVPTGHLNSGHTKSCGCLFSEGNNLKHGHNKHENTSKEYRVWQNMKRSKWEVCKEWDSFEIFLQNAGTSPTPYLVLRMKDVNLGYNVNNCYWGGKPTKKSRRRGIVHANFKHGKSKTVEYKTWDSIKARCYNIKNIRYKNYGGRGIKVCDKWLASFEDFYKDMGDRPSPDHSIERRENDKDYCPENCFWATRIQQMNNTSRSVYYEYNGISLSQRQWERKLRLKPGHIHNKIKNGASFDDIYLRNANSFIPHSFGYII